MRKIVWAAFAVACFYGMLPAARPMEALNHYNVILVHGAAPESQGYGNECSETIKDAWNTRNDFVSSMRDTTKGKKLPWNLGDAVGMLGDYESKDDTKLTYWLDSVIFEDSVQYGSEYIYIQRAFTNPAESPAHNAHEIGDRTWKGDNNCSVRRSLFEEAQEVRAGGRNRLQQLRTNGVDGYRAIPSRNILIAHSMGGVASHEYVTGQSVYNDDVDKMITLDSPHEGTGSLNLLLDMRKYGRQLGEATVEYMIGWATAAVIAGVEPVTPTVAAYIMAASFGFSTLNRVVTTFVDLSLGEKYAFKEEDSLSKYIPPDADGITSLRDRPYNENLPMVRLLAGKGGMTFSDPNGSYAKYTLNFFIPEALSAPIGNIMTQVIDGDGSASAVYVNSVTGLSLGVIGGITLWDVGTTLIPEYSGLAENTKAFTDPNADVESFTFDAAAHANEASMVPLVTANVVTLAATVGGIIAAHYALAAFPYAQVAAKLGIAVAGAGLLALELHIADAGIKDLTDSHENAKARRMLDTLYSADFSYTKVNGGNVSGPVRLMEDFLYERPFVSLGLFVSDSTLRAVEPGCYYEADKANKQQLCEVGLFGADGKVAGSNGKKNYSEFRKGDLKFKSESDWSQMGVKIDRWEKVDGLKPGSDSVSKKSVPIRHVERYGVPAITVEDWIEKYSFVVDDLMPHRLRQIRMNFNFQEEIAWECDITKDSDADDACTVYGRSGGGSWKNPIVIVDSVETDSGKIERRVTIDKVPHPVKKNGQFDFEPRKYGYVNLLAIQKDNQNTVTISTVNKIGLSNTQRFYYLFKATANMLEPKWPRRGIVLNKMKDFCSYASALGYQGFRVVGAKDKVLSDSAGTFNEIVGDADMDMVLEKYVDASGKEILDRSSAVFSSNHKGQVLAENSYIWKYTASIENSEDPNSHADTSNTYEVPFRIDRTSPKFEVTPESPLMNPERTPFVARFKWTDSALATPDIRAMRWTLERASGQSSSSIFVHVCDFRSLYEVSTPDFAVAWNDNCRAQVKNLGDGLYRVKAFAVDYAVPDSNVYKKMNGLVNAIAVSPNYVEQSRWPTDADSVNTSTEYASFTIDSHKPSLVLDSSKSVFTATADSLLKIAYVVHDQNFGPDSTPVTIRWDFVHAADTAKADRAGDSVWVKKDTVVGTWEESGSMRLEDGSYELRAQVRDAAGNDSVYKKLANLRVDKTAPYIESLVSSSLLSPDSATLKVSEKFDVQSNKFGVECRYRILGGDANTNWHNVPRDSVNQYERVFALDSAAIGLSHGKRYLEVACKDVAGNVSYRTDLFHVGARYPTITSPDSSEKITSALVAITGMAPPSGLSDSEHAIFRLRYRNVDGLVPEHATWQMSRAYVTQALRSGTQNVSRAAQVNEGVLGYIDRSTPEGEKIAGTYEIELSTCTADTASCYADTSLWISDIMTVSFNMVSPGAAGGKPSVQFALRVKDTLNPVSMTIGKDSLDVSLTLSGAFKNNYLIRVYAEGDDHVGIFEKSVSKAFRNPYYGYPADTAKSNGVWFYQDSLGYHLKWKGLSEGDSLKVSFASDRFGNTCESAAGGANLSSCVVRASAFNFVELPTVARSYLEDFPEWIPPSYVDSVMMLAGDSGHVLMTAEAAFQVSFVRNFADTSNVKIPVYFASSNKDATTPPPTPATNHPPTKPRPSRRPPSGGAPSCRAASPRLAPPNPPAALPILPVPSHPHFRPPSSSVPVSPP